MRVAQKRSASSQLWTPVQAVRTDGSYSQHTDSSALHFSLQSHLWPLGSSPWLADWREKEFKVGLEMVSRAGTNEKWFAESLNPHKGWPWEWKEIFHCRPNFKQCIYLIFTSGQRKDGETNGTILYMSKLIAGLDDQRLGKNKTGRLVTRSGEKEWVDLSEWIKSMRLFSFHANVDQRPYATKRFSKIRGLKGLHSLMYLPLLLSP